jgi:putative membrane protein
LFGDDVLAFAITLGVVLQVIAVLVVLGRAWGVKRTALICLSIVIAAWFVEFTGHTTGFPFGEYDYTDRLQPQFGGVPALIPLAWLMMLPPSWAIADRIMAWALRGVKGIRRNLAFIGFTALAFTAWDLFLDPQMVEWNMWVWNDPGTINYFGIPWINFAGWLLASGLITALVLGIRRNGTRHGIASQTLSLPTTPLIIVYGITWLLQTGGQLFFWNLPASGIVGFFAMGIMIALALIPRRTA